MLAMNKMKLLSAVGAAVAIAAVVTSCGDGTTRSRGWEFSRNMYDPLGYNPDQPNPNFADGKTAQMPPAGTVPVGFERFAYVNTMEDYERRSEEHTSELQSLMRISYAVFCLKKKNRYLNHIV